MSVLKNMTKVDSDFRTVEQRLTTLERLLLDQGFQNGATIPRDELLQMEEEYFGSQQPSERPRTLLEWTESDPCRPGAFPHPSGRTEGWCFYGPFEKTFQDTLKTPLLAAPMVYSDGPEKGKMIGDDTVAHVEVNLCNAIKLAGLAEAILIFLRIKTDQQTVDSLRAIQHGLPY